MLIVTAFSRFLLMIISLCSNYEFAKYCWKVLVQPQIYSAAPDDQKVTCWQLDSDHKYRSSDGVIDLLLRHLRATSMPDKQVTIATSNSQYSLSVDVVVDSVSVCFGCSHATNSLVEIQFAQISLCARALLSEAGAFLPDLEDRNRICFRSVISARYLNTKHNHMEAAIEPYPCYGSLTYRIDATQQDEESEFSV